MEEIFSPGFSVSADVNIDLKPSYTSHTLSASAMGMQFLELGKGLGGHADGGIFDRPHVAWFAEDGPEAAIPLDGSSNAVSLWKRVGMLLGVLDGGMTASAAESLYNGVSTYRTSDNSKTDDSTDSRQFIFSPQIIIEGNADKENVEEAISISMEQFREMMEQCMAERSRVSFG